MSDPSVSDYDTWRDARVALLQQEKELTRQRDRVSAARRALPMVEVDDKYRFNEGSLGLADLFEGRSQLLIYHFMFGPDDDEGCPRCSFMVDNIGDLSHLHARDTTLALVSRAPLEKLAAYRDRLGWQVPWYSSLGSSFNYQFGVSFDEAVQPLEYNFTTQAELERENPAWKGWIGEEQGISAFLRRDGRVFHTYSCYDRGSEIVNATWHWLDLTARGRQEVDSPMSWVRRHDEYA